MAANWRGFKSFKPDFNRNSGRCGRYFHQNTAGIGATLARAANPTQKYRNRWCDGATPNLETFQRFCMVASGSNIKNKHHQTSNISISGLRDSWHRWRNQLWNGATHFGKWQSHLILVRCNGSVWLPCCPIIFDINGYTFLGCEIKMSLVGW